MERKTMTREEVEDFEVYPIFGFMFKEPFNKLSSDAKVVFAIRRNERNLISTYKNLGADKKYYSFPSPRTFDEIMVMTGLSSQQVYDAHIELERAGLYKKEDFNGIET